jgi:hypothetical protein
MKVLRPEQCVIFHGKACAACTEDIELENEMNELEIKIEKILVKRRALRTVMNENHDPFIYSFPPEIASHIFIQYAPPSALFEKDNRGTPLYLGAVCRKWRQLAWATPRLWSSLLVGFRLRGRYNCSNESDLPQLVAEWLERSAILPLTIRLDLSGHGFEDHGDAVYCTITTNRSRHCHIRKKNYSFLFALNQKKIYRPSRSKFFPKS